MEDKHKQTGKSGLKILKGVAQPDSINVKALHRSKYRKADDIPVEEYFQGIIHGDRNLLSRAITLIESSLQSHQFIAQQILEKCLPLSGNSLRIGITGIPGVGKSTFIEAIGGKLISQGKKVAVLAVDPSSSRTKGSILGDKTRMTKLSTETNAFIRPSPSAGTLGGVAQKTRETIFLCEASGYDVIFVETVGVGQSETVVHSMVDFFLVLMLAGAGDELQGIKRGIMELADLILINKSDDSPLKKIELAQQVYKNALHLFPPKESGWIPRVGYCSSVTLYGIDQVWDILTEYFHFCKQNDYFNMKRKEQAKFWFYETINNELKRYFFNNKKISGRLRVLEQSVIKNEISPFVAAQQLLSLYK